MTLIQTSFLGRQIDISFQTLNRRWLSHVKLTSSFDNKQTFKINLTPTLL